MGILREGLCRRWDSNWMMRKGSVWNCVSRVWRWDKAGSTAAGSLCSSSPDSEGDVKMLCPVGQDLGVVQGPLAPGREQGTNACSLGMGPGACLVV